MTDTDGFQQQIAETLYDAAGNGAEGRIPFRELPGRRHTTYMLLADAVLPIVTAWAEQQARQRAVEELRAVAEEFRSDRDDATTGEDPGDPWTYNEAALTCTQRADALTSEDPASSLGRK